MRGIMSRGLQLLCLCLLPACALFKRPPRPVHAPPEEAASFEFPVGIPEEGRVIVRRPLAHAIQLAMEDYLPWDFQPPKGDRPGGECLYRRESYDVIAAPHGNGIILVSISLDPDACERKGIPHDMGALYAIDSRTWRILAIQH